MKKYSLKEKIDALNDRLSRWIEHKKTFYANRRAGLAQKHKLQTIHASLHAIKKELKELEAYENNPLIIKLDAAAKLNLRTSPPRFEKFNKSYVNISKVFLTLQSQEIK